MSDGHWPDSSPVPRPHPSRCSPSRDDYDAIIRAHEDAVRRGEPTYRDPTTNLTVLTVATHLERGTCCDSGCRHCPYLD
ncbi:MAG: DUF5522 domain-containing protein [Acidimicrobiales bacterium]|jgi:hypothetical protein